MLCEPVCIKLSLFERWAEIASDLLYFCNFLFLVISVAKTFTRVSRTTLLISSSLLIELAVETLEGMILILQYDG